MSDLDVCRSTRLVSIDTHPANNSLVVTYEILAVIRDGSDGREIGRRNKRDQFQINISDFDNLTGKSTPLNMCELSEKIIAKCPILAESNRIETLEDIQLNLLYLFNRKQAQLNQPNRPSSSASIRSKTGVPSAQSGGRTSSAAIRTKDSTAQKSTQPVENPLEVYQDFCEKELDMARQQDFLDYERLDEFVVYLDEHLIEYESELGLEPLSRNQLELNIEAQLEDLYGEIDERRRSIAVIRQAVRDDTRLISVSSNRLLVCAILRILRDSGSGRDLPMSESILYCLIRFTSFEDVFTSMAFSEAIISADTGGGSESLDLIRVVVDLLDDQIRWLTTNSENQTRLLPSNSYYTNSLLIILTNLMRLDYANGRHHLKRKLIQQQNGLKLANILTTSLSLVAKHLQRDIRTSNKPQERITVTLMEILSICKQFSIFKQFISLIRTAPLLQILIDSLVTILNCLQLSRPGSGSSQLQQVLANDRATLTKVYQLEIESMSLISNLMFDSKLRERLTRKSLLLKCVLRSLVVFLASSRKSNTFNPFSRSLVLIAPLRCLYELSCSDTIKGELFESRVIMRCLLEYLLISSLDLKSSIELCRQDIERERDHDDDEQKARALMSSSDLTLNEGDQIVLSPQDSNQFIVCLWINLSTRHEASIYKRGDERDDEAMRLLGDYIKLALKNLDSFIDIVAAGRQQQSCGNRSKLLKNLHLINYLHMKLVRNFSQFLDPVNFESSQNELVAIVATILKLDQQIDTFVPMLVESLALLTNIVDRNLTKSSDEFKSKIASVLVTLFGDRYSLIDCSNSSGSDIENDDLLLVAINCLSTLAKQHEICPQLKSISIHLIKIINSILDLRASDTQMLICAIFCLNQLLGHASFLQVFGLLLDESTRDEEQVRRLSARQLLEQLCALVQHPDSLVVMLADQILNKLKQFEESQSLADSVTCKKRFVSHNAKWLHAIRMHQDDPTNSNSPGSAEMELNLEAFQNDQPNSAIATGDLDKQQFEFDDYRQLRTINADDLTRTSSSLSQSSSTKLVNCSVNKFRRNEDEEDYFDDDDDQAECDLDEDTFSEPDINVIDPMSTIGHLRSRQELQD